VGAEGPSLDGVDWKRIEPLFDGTASWDIDGFTLPGADGVTAESITGAWVSSGYFKTLSVRPAFGRPFRAEEYAARARSRSSAMSSGGDVFRARLDHHRTHRADVLRPIIPRAATSITVVGVLVRSSGQFIGGRAAFSVPFLPDEAGAPLLGRRKRGVTAAATETQLDAVLRPQIRADAACACAWYRRSTVTPRTTKPVLIATLAAALFMLLAAGASVASTIASRSAARRHEVGIRLALGASSSRIARQVVRGERGARRASPAR
jgi:hypothetical protein